MAFDALKVPELKDFLQERGVTCHLYNKSHLVRLCNLASELNLEIIRKKGEVKQRLYLVCCSQVGSKADLVIHFVSGSRCNSPILKLMYIPIWLVISK